MDKMGLLGIIGLNEGGSGGTSNYEDLSNKPSINGVTLTGNKSAADLGITGGSKIYKFESSHFTGLSESEIADLQEIINNRLAGEDSIIFIDDIIVTRIFTNGSLLLLTTVNLNHSTENNVKAYQWWNNQNFITTIQDYNLAVQSRVETFYGETLEGDDYKALKKLQDWLNEYSNYGVVAIPDEFAIYVNGQRLTHGYAISPSSSYLYSDKWEYENSFQRVQYELDLFIDDEQATISETTYEQFSNDSGVKSIVADSEENRNQLLYLIQSDWEIQEAIRQIIEG